MPDYKPQIPRIVDPSGVNPGLQARPMPVTTDRSRAYTAQATGGKPLVDFAGTSNPYVDYQSIDLLLSLQHPRSEGYDEMCFFVMGQVKELLFKAPHFELYNGQRQIRADAHKCSKVGATPGSVLSRHNPQKLLNFRSAATSPWVMRRVGRMTIGVSSLVSSSCRFMGSRSLRIADSPRTRPSLFVLVRVQRGVVGAALEGLAADGACKGVRHAEAARRLG